MSISSFFNLRFSSVVQAYVHKTTTSTIFINAIILNVTVTKLQKWFLFTKPKHISFIESLSDSNIY